MMNFKQSFKLFLESKELGILRPRPLSGSELSKAKAAAGACALIHDVVQKKNEDVNDGDIKALHKGLMKYSKIKFVKNLIATLDDMIHSHSMSSNAGEYIVNNHGELKSNLRNMKDAFMKKDLRASAEHKQKLDAQIDRVNHHIDLGKKVHTHLINRYKSEPSIFGTTRLLSRISSEDYQKIAALDFSEPLYTALDFPTNKEDDFDYVLYFLTHLSASPKPIRIDTEHDFRLHSKVHNSSNSNFEELSSLIDKYLHSNNKELIPRIVKLVNSIPSIRDANEKAKRKTKIVYRGLGFNAENDMSEEEILEKEHEQKYVATSDSKYAAKNFALQKGHLESEDSRRSSHGVIIVYEVTADAILFDTRVIDTVYNESEILIDSTKATVKEIIEV